MGNNALKTVAFWFLMVLVMMFVLSNMEKRDQRRNRTLSYSEFLSESTAGAVASAIVMAHPSGQGFSIRGELKDKTTFDLMAPSGDPELFKVMRQGQVAVTVKPMEQGFGQLLLQFLLAWGPILLLAFIWFFFINRMQSGGPGGALTFGKARAKQLQSSQARITFADVAGVDEAKEELKEIIDFLKDPGRYQKLGGKIPKGVLLLGPPGTGKTLLARAVAGEAGRPFFSISGSDFVEMFVGVGASRVRDLFEQGKKSAPCIIFVDEIDAVGRHRGAGLGGGHDEREQTLNALLVEMDGFEFNTGVIIMAATNRPDVLDPALTRPGRFDRQVVVDRPDINGRDAILRVHTRQVVLAPDVDVKALAQRTPGFSGADLANLVNEGALLATRRNKKAVTMDELTECIERVMAGPQRKSRVMTEKEKKITAYHEAGHALVAYLLPNTDPIYKISIIPRGYGVLGYVLRMPTEDRFLSQRGEMLSNLTVAMGGRVSEELVFNDISTGAANDLEKATSIARAMVMRYGMSQKVGHVSFGEEREVFLGRDWVREKNYSERTAQLVDDEVKKLVEEAHRRARALLLKNRKLLEKLAQELLSKEMIEGSQVDQILGKTPKTPPPKLDARAASAAAQAAQAKLGEVAGKPAAKPAAALA